MTTEEFAHLGSTHAHLTDEQVYTTQIPVVLQTENDPDDTWLCVARRRPDDPHVPAAVGITASRLVANGLAEVLAGSFAEIAVMPVYRPDVDDADLAP